MTDRAREQIENVQRAEARAAQVLRLRVLAGGCSGLSYHLGWEDSSTEADEILVFGGVRVAVDPASMGFVGDVEIDYESGLYGAGFKFNNPIATTGCGCGQSFGV